MSPHIIHHPDIIQGTDEWHALRCGILTASAMDRILTPTLKTADNKEQRTHLYELLSQRITNYVEPEYISDDMLRGNDDEDEARKLYAKIYGDVGQVGFITNDSLGFKIGYSPDGLVGDHGLIEIKSRRQKFQTRTFIEDVTPAEFMLQIQAGLFVSGRVWCDFVSYCGGMPLFVKRVERDEKMIAAITTAATAFEASLNEKLEIYRQRTLNLQPTKRRMLEII